MKMLRVMWDAVKKVDPILFGATAFLSLLSIVTIFGAVDNFGRSKLVMQTAMAVLGIVMIFIISNIDYKFFVDKFYILFFAVYRLFYTFVVTNQ